MPDRYLYQKKAFLESQIIAHEMMLAELYRRKTQVLSATRLDSFFPLALAITERIQRERRANLACKAEHEHIVAILSKG